ncbi:MAG: hypothetical protein K5682_09120, partial [Lachnospiraceae bacterium]|nr:hypothetical protein [Lachnospiraceae bacterium]
ARKEGVDLDFLEGKQLIRMPIDYKKPTRVHINMNGEDYLVALTGAFGKNEDNIPVLSLRMCFVEEATERRLKIYFNDVDNISLKWDEIPGNTMIQDTMEMVTTGSGNTSGIANLLMDQIPMDIIKREVATTIGITVKAQRKKMESLEESSDNTVQADGKPGNNQ